MYWIASRGIFWNIREKRTRNAGQSDTHLAKGHSNMDVACNSQPQAELLLNMCNAHAMY